MRSQFSIAKDQFLRTEPGNKSLDNSSLSDNGSPARLPELASRLSASLATTLELEELLRLYSSLIHTAIPHTGIHYEHHQLNFLTGIANSHVLEIELTIDENSLGILTLYREWEFKQADVNILFFTLNQLAYPLRNVLLYKQALSAAHRDALTGIYNRTTLDDHVQRQINLAHRYHQFLSLLVLDIDHFKKINDEHGHTAGDCVIKGVARVLEDCIRNTDILFRFGGEEFVILAPNTRLSGAVLLAQRIRATIESATNFCQEAEIRTTVSLGIAQLETGESGEELFKRADKALYLAKKSGRNRVQTSDNLLDTQT